MEISSDMRPETPERVVKVLEDKIADWQEALQGEGFAWDRIVGFAPGSRSWGNVLEIVEILNSHASDNEKAHRLVPLLKMIGEDPKINAEREARVAKCVKNFRSSAQLDAHLASLRERERQRKAEEDAAKQAPQPAPP